MIAFRPRPFRHVVLILAAVTVAADASVAAEKKEKQEPALGGYCPVSYMQKNEAIKGDPAFRSVHIGETYYLASAEAKKKFDAGPEAYLPQLGGLCTMALGGPYGNRIPGDPTVFAVRGTRLYLFSSERAKRLWEKSPQVVIERAYKLFSQPVASGYCPVSYQQRKAAVKGSSPLASVYKTYVYHMATSEAKELFDKDPERYIPKYRGFCAVGISENMRKSANPQVFRVRKGRTYLFKDEAAAKKFDAKPDQIIKRADANWDKLKGW